MYGIRCFLCSQIASALAAAIFFSRFTPRHSLLVAMLGAARTRCAQTSCRLFPIIARLLAVPPNAALPPLAGDYLCYEDSLTYIVESNSKVNRFIISIYKEKAEKHLCSSALYPDPGSNRDGLPHWCLRPARLPIPPSGQLFVSQLRVQR